MDIAIVVFPGVEELDFVGPLEVFGLATGLGCDIRMRLVAWEPAVRCFHGLMISDLHPPKIAADLVVVPGGAWLAGGNTGVRRAVDEGKIAAWLAERFAGGAVVASVCTGAFLLQAAGLLSDVPATTHHSALADLRGLGVEIGDGRVVDAGRIVTAGGITSGLDLALHLVARFYGRDAADEVRRILEYSPGN